MPDHVASKVDKFFSSYPKRSYPKGQIIVFGGEDPEYIYYMTKGVIRKYDVSYRGDEVVVNLFKPPAYFPMSWAINKTPNKYFYKTETATELHIIPAEYALKFIKANPDVMLDLLSRVYKGTDGLTGRVVHLMSGSARSRLVYELIIECRRFGQQSSDGSKRLVSNEADLAAHSGLSRETVSREMRGLKADGIVSIKPEGIFINNLEALESKLGKEI